MNVKCKQKNYKYSINQIKYLDKYNLLDNRICFKSYYLIWSNADRVWLMKEICFALPDTIDG